MFCMPEATTNSIWPSCQSSSRSAVLRTQSLVAPAPCLAHLVQTAKLFAGCIAAVAGIAVAGILFHEAAVWLKTAVWNVAQIAGTQPIRVIFAIGEDIVRIAVFSDNFYPEIGGIQDSIEALAKALSQRGYFVDFYVPKYGRGDYELIKAEPHEIWLGNNIRICRLCSIPFPSSTRQSRMVLPSPISWLRLLHGQRPDIIHSQTFFGVGLNALVTSRILRIPIVGTNHMAIKAFGSYVPAGMDKIVAYVLWYYNHCDLVTAPSRSVFSELGSGKLRAPHDVVSNPIATEIFRPVSLERQRELKREFCLRGLAVAYAGRLGAEKNIDTIFRALALVKRQIPSIELAIAGHGNFEKHLRGLARQLSIEAYVKFLGTLSKQSLARLFQACDVFVTMSPSETQGMALLQAMACGTPVVGANVRALPEYINEECGFVLDPFDANSLSDRIVHLLADATLRSRLGRNATSFAQQFSTEVIVDKWESVYRTAMLRKGNSDEESYQAQFRRTGA
jgi:1,2-diacylglycerol 3-alpha-glucosyltransferase